MNYIQFNRYMEEVLATVNINIGLGIDNPSLIIREGDHVPTLVNRLIHNYNLPKKVYAIIMERVAQELPPPLPQPSHTQFFNKTAKIEKETTVSPIKSVKSFTPKHAQTRLLATGKENNRNTANIALNQSKNFTKKQLSPINKTSAPTVKKLEIKSSKSPAKITSYPARPSAKPIKTVDSNSHVHKLFKYLTKCNPAQLQMLSHQHINLKGMDRQLLSTLQDFFECLEEDEFDRMSEGYFTLRVEQLGFKKKLWRREYQ